MNIPEKWKGKISLLLIDGTEHCDVKIIETEETILGECVTISDEYDEQKVCIPIQRIIAVTYDNESK